MANDENEKGKTWFQTLSRCQLVLGVVIALGSTMGMAYGAKKALDQVWTPTHRFEILEAMVQKDVERLDKKIIRDEINWRRQKCANWIGKYGSVAGMPPEVRAEYMRLQGEIADYQKQLGE
jgi:hypothetical protein